MNLQTKLDERVWEAIRSSYENRNFTGAILDSIYFLSDLLREKAGLESDGVVLVGQALGGNSPKLKVNKLQSESDWNIQKGTEQLLRGVYQAIRNPRSHEKMNDSEDDAHTLILFINYLAKMIDQSRTPFSRQEFVRRVLDPDFVPQKRYAELLVAEIPEKQRLSIFLEVYSAKEQIEGEALRYFFDALLPTMTDEERIEAYSVVSEELKYTDSEPVIRRIIQGFGSKVWPNFSEAARLRIENKLIRSIKEGQYNGGHKRCFGGSLGTWACRILSEFTLKKEVVWALTEKLDSSDEMAQDYVLQFFFHHFSDLEDKPSPYLEHILDIIRNKLQWVGA